MRFGEWVGCDGRGGRARSSFRSVPIGRAPSTSSVTRMRFGQRRARRCGPSRTPLSSCSGPLRSRDEPYLLVLDEMNLAHVERYFADFLSGVESRLPILPVLRDATANGLRWKARDRVPIPRNLIVVGTVNVDETTYLFSPKVLDRAFTFEFRTTTARSRPSSAPADDGRRGG